MTDCTEITERFKAEMLQEIERYDSEFNNGLRDRSCKIGDFERMMVAHRQKCDEIARRYAAEMLSQAETEHKKCPVCGKPMPVLKRDQIKRVKTLEGELPIERDYCYCRTCRQSYVPLDERIGIDQLAHAMTDAVRAKVAYYGQHERSFDEASQMIERSIGLQINEETVRVVTEEIGKAVFEVDEARAQEEIEHMEKIVTSDGEPIADTLYIMTDGAAVNTRVENENGSTWRENKLVVAFTNRDMIRRKNGEGIILRKEYSALIGNAEEFRKFMLDTALRAGYGRVKEVVVISDGATWIRHACEEIFPDAVQILDIFHLKENIYTFARDIFSQDKRQYTPWAERIIAMIESGDVDGALQEVKSKGPSKAINLQTYIENNRGKVDYCRYRQNGWFVGSGAIESANKLVLQRRLKQAGMRWSVAGAQAVLALRCKAESDRWAEVVEQVCA